MAERKVCVITGATGGIGTCMVKKFYENDYDVVMLDIKEDVLSALAEREGYEKERVSWYELDVSSEEVPIKNINNNPNKEYTVNCLSIITPTSI